MIKSFFMKSFSVVFILLFTFVQSCPAGSAGGSDYIPKVSTIEIHGNNIVSDSIILNKIKTREGAELSREIVNEDIKRLYASGYFQDVKFNLVPDGKNFRVVIIVEEKPIINKIIINGNTVLDDKNVLKLLGIKEGEILDPYVLKEGIVKIENRYTAKGYKFVTVTDKVKVNERDNSAVVYITIEEGKKYKIRSITFEGVKAFKEKELKRKMYTKEKRFWRSGVFRKEKFEADIEKIEYMYQKNGYLDVAVNIRFKHDKKKHVMDIIISVDEGARYFTGDVKIEGNELFPDSEVWSQLKMLPGEVYSEIGLRQDVDSLRRFYFEKGYINARIIPDTKLDSANKKVNVTYTITEGHLYYVDKVKIRGNTKTKDMVIRRELRVYPGEKFDGKKLNYSKERLENLGYFEEVTYETEPGSAENKRDVIFNVKEKQTGEISFGAGISSIDQFIGFAEIAQKNFDLLGWPTFTGGGQNLSLKGRIGSVTKDIDLRFTEPYLMNKNISFSLNVYNWDRTGNNVDFDTRRRGIGVVFGRNFTDRVKGFVGYTLENVKISDISDDADPQVRASGIRNDLSRFKFGLTYDSRDNVFVPKKGWYISGVAEVVGGYLAGDEDYYSFVGSVSKYFSFKKEHVIELRGRIGVMDDFGDSKQVPVYDRFYAGGLGTVRGFGYRRVGPKGGGDAIGGETLVLGTVEYTFPLIENFKGALFIDAGHVNPDCFEVDTSEFSVSIGPGLKINTPIGPITLYYGLPIANKDTEDKNGRFEFNLSRGF